MGDGSRKNSACVRDVAALRINAENQHPVIAPLLSESRHAVWLSLLWLLSAAALLWEQLVSFLM